MEGTGQSRQGGMDLGSRDQGWGLRVAQGQAQLSSISAAGAALTGRARSKGRTGKHMDLGSGGRKAVGQGRARQGRAGAVTDGLHGT